MINTKDLTWSNVVYSKQQEYILQYGNVVVRFKRIIVTSPENEMNTSYVVYR